jgi:hypothetical protein
MATVATDFNVYHCLAGNPISLVDTASFKRGSSVFFPLATGPYHGRIHQLPGLSIRVPNVCLGKPYAPPLVTLLQVCAT